jgi:hypothetical protein
VRRKDHDDYWCAGAYIINKIEMKGYLDQILVPVHFTFDATEDVFTLEQLYTTRKFSGALSSTGVLNIASTIHGLVTNSSTGTEGSLTQAGKEETRAKASEWLGAHIISGYDKPACTPSVCCAPAGPPDSSRSVFQADRAPCVRAGRGYAADNFIYNIPYGNAYMLTVPVMTGAIYGNRSTLHQEHVSLHVSAFNRINSLVQEMKSGVAPHPSFLNINCMFNRSAL